MNPKQTVPLAVTLAPVIAAAPPVLIGAAIGLGIIWLLKCLSDAEPTKQPETMPASQAGIPRKLPEPAVFRQIPAEVLTKPVAVPRPAVPRVAVPPTALPSVPKIAAPVPVPVAVIVPKVMPQVLPPPPIKKKVVTREDMATVFQRGARTLTRPAAVAALKSLGFGKTAAYAALLPDGRFAAWLKIAPDGIIAWTDGQKT